MGVVTGSISGGYYSSDGKKVHRKAHSVERPGNVYVRTVSNEGRQVGAEA